MHETGHLVACQPLFFRLSWGEDDDETASRIDEIDTIVLIRRWSMRSGDESFPLQKLTFSEEAVLQTSWALQSVDLPGEIQLNFQVIFYLGVNQKNITVRSWITADNTYIHWVIATHQKHKTFQFSWKYWRRDTQPTRSTRSARWSFSAKIYLNF